MLQHSRLSILRPARWICGITKRCPSWRCLMKGHWSPRPSQEDYLRSAQPFCLVKICEAPGCRLYRACGPAARTPSPRSRLGGLQASRRKYRASSHLRTLLNCPECDRPAAPGLGRVTHGPAACPLPAGTLRSIQHARSAAVSPGTNVVRRAGFLSEVRQEAVAQQTGGSPV